MHNILGRNIAAVWWLVCSASLAQAATPLIVSAVVNTANTQVTIGGASLAPTAGAPVVKLDSTTLTLVSYASTQIVADLPSGLSDGTYRLTVNNGSASLGVIGMTLGAGAVALPFAGSGTSTGAAFNITNTSPTGTAIAGQGGVSSSGADRGSTGVGAYGGDSGGGGSTAGLGLYAHGGGATGETDTGGVGVSANGGNGTATGNYGGAGIVARGGNSGTSGEKGGDGIDAYAGTSGFSLSGPDAVYGDQTASYGYAGDFNGNVTVSGTFSNPAAVTKIDDPMDAANKYFFQATVSSSEMKNIYDGNAVTDGSGNAVVTLPAWFEAYNGEFRYQLTAIGQPARAWISSEISNNMFSIKTDRPNVKISWQVTGVRQDAWAKAHPVQLEVEKAPEDKGRYIHPELYGHADEPSIAQTHHPRPPE